MFSCSSEMAKLHQSSSSTFSFLTSFSSASCSFGWHHQGLGEYLKSPISTTLVWEPVFASWCVLPLKGNYLHIQQGVTSMSDHHVTIYTTIPLLHIYQSKDRSYLTGICSLPAHCGTTSDETSRPLWWSVWWFGPWILFGFTINYFNSSITAFFFFLPLPSFIFFLGGSLKSLSASSVPPWWKTTNCGDFGPGSANLYSAVPAHHHFVCQRSSKAHRPVSNIA